VVKIKNISYIWERIYPLFLSLFVTILLICRNFTPELKGFDRVLDGSITFISIVLGFLAALVGIILSVSGTKAIKNIYQYVNDKNGGNVFIAYVKAPIRMGFLSLVISIIMLILIEYMSFVTLIITYLWIFTTVYFILASYRVVNIMMIALLKELKHSVKE